MYVQCVDLDLKFIQNINIDKQKQVGINEIVAGKWNIELITISGDYGINGEIRIGKKKDITGDFYIDNLPIIFDKINKILN